MKWAAGDLFFTSDNPGKIYRIRRIKGKTIWYLPNHYGENPPRGILRKSRDGEQNSWIKVERNYNE